MKITKRQLKRIIREEKEKLLRENPEALRIPQNPASLAEDAAHAAMMHIQDAMGIESGDAAGMYWSGPEWDQLIAMLTGYIEYEIQTDHTYR